MSVSASSSDEFLSEKVRKSNDSSDQELAESLLPHSTATRRTAQYARLNIILYLGVASLIFNALWSIYLASNVAGKGTGDLCPNLIHCTILAPPTRSLSNAL